MPIYSAIALTAAALWLCWRCLALRRPWARTKLGLILSLSPAALLLVPLGDGLLLIHYLHGFFGALSISSLALMGASLAVRSKPLPRSLPVYCGLLLTAVLLYASAEGWLHSDIYAWGYAGWQLPTIISALLIASVIFGNYLAAYLLTAVILAYALDLHPSPNLWDLILDFPLALTTLTLTLRSLLRKFS